MKKCIKGLALKYVSIVEIMDRNVLKWYSHVKRIKEETVVKTFIGQRWRAVEKA
jgi:hypothetical protein